jgi:hypothetical protein
MSRVKRPFAAAFVGAMFAVALVGQGNAGQVPDARETITAGTRITVPPSPADRTWLQNDTREG